MSVNEAIAWLENQGYSKTRGEIADMLREAKGIIESTEPANEKWCQRAERWLKE